jgi:hypothetical protein
MERSLLKGFFPKECVHTPISAPPLTTVGIDDPRVGEWVRLLRTHGNNPKISRAADDEPPSEVVRRSPEEALAVLWRIVVEPILRGVNARAV